MNEHYIALSLTEVCLAVELPEHAVVELVEHDIVNPVGNDPSEWRFDATMVTIAKRAVRLYRDLELDWAAVAIIEELIEQREQLQSENAELRRRLQRFLDL